MFEGPTLLAEAIDGGVEIESIYATSAAYADHRAVRDLESHGVPVYILDDRTIQKISDVETSSGIVCVAPIVYRSAAQALDDGALTLVLADLNDPANAGTLLRTAEAFGVRGVIFGTLGVEAYLPKVVRGSMGAIFRMEVAAASPDEVKAPLGGRQVTGLASDGDPIGSLEWAPGGVLVVGNERHGLAAWASICTRSGAIPMPGKAESLNAGVAGSIALYEATKRRYA